MNAKPLLLACGLIVGGLLDCSSTAQPPAEPQPATQDDGKGDADTPESPFVVPDGDMDDLFAFLRRVQTSQLPSNMRSRAGSHQFLRFQVEASLAACNKIDALEPDEDIQLKLIQQRIGAWRALSQIDDAADAQLETYIKTLKSDPRPEVQKTVRSHELTSSARGFFQLPSDGRDGVLQNLFAYMDDFGIDQTSYSLASQLGKALEQSTNPQQGAVIYERLARELREIGDAGLTPEIVRYEGTARRLNLPGQFMDLKGTTADGKDFDWSTYRGKVVLVDFWATWCGPCRAQIPNIKAQLEKYGDQGFAVIGISLDETKAQFQAYVDGEQIPWENLMSVRDDERGWANPIAVHYGVGSLPTAILVDKEGKVVSMSALGGELNRLLDQMLGEPEPPPPAE